jgi:hypothetical protein
MQYTAAQMARPMSRESLYALCRLRVHLKYGWNGHDGKYYLYTDQSVHFTEYCVANRGKID